MPWCDHTGVPRHFHSSVTPGTARWISERTRARVLPRQSGSSAMRASMRASMRAVGESATGAAFGAIVRFVAFVVALVVAFVVAFVDLAAAFAAGFGVGRGAGFAFEVVVFAAGCVVFFMRGERRPENGAARSAHRSALPGDCNRRR